MSNITHLITKARNQKAFDEGAAAFRLGTPLAGCPYITGTDGRAHWRFGWIDQQQKKARYEKTTPASA